MGFIRDRSGWTRFLTQNRDRPNTAQIGAILGNLDNEIQKSQPPHNSGFDLVNCP